MKKRIRESAILGGIALIATIIVLRTAEEPGEEVLEETPTVSVETQQTEVSGKLKPEVEVVLPKVDKTQANEPVYISLGEFRVTAYCSCSECCEQWAANRPGGIVYGASGEVLVPHHSIAVDPNVIPYGSTVYINGQAYIAQDCGGAIKGNSIDIYMASHEEAYDFGVQYLEVFMKEGEQ